MGDCEAVAFGAAFLEECGDRVSSGPRDALLALLARLSTIMYRNARAEEFIAQIQAPSDLPPRARQNMIIAQMDIAFSAGDVAAWSSHAARLFEIIATVPPFTALTALYTLTRSASYLGLGAIAERALARADRIEAQWNFPVLRGHGSAVRAMNAYLSGRLELARTEIADAFCGTAAPVARAALALVAPHVAAALGEPLLVPSQIGEELTSLRRAASDVDDAAILAAGAVTSLGLGELGEAREYLRLALSCIPRVLSSCGDIVALAARHLEVTELGRLRELIAGPFAVSDVPGRTHAALAAAILEQRFGDPIRACECANAAAAGYRELGQPLFEARALEIAGERDAARILFSRCGATAEMRRLARPGTGDLPAHTNGVLSTREADVGRGIARGESNALIADRLSVSVSTVEKHITSIFAKLRLRNRSQIAAAFARDE